jgi:hypothetical protein
MRKSFNTRDQIGASSLLLYPSGLGVDLFRRQLADDLLSRELNPELMRFFVTSARASSGLHTSQSIAKSYHYDRNSMICRRLTIAKTPLTLRRLSGPIVGAVGSRPIQLALKLQF